MLPSQAALELSSSSPSAGAGAIQRVSFEQLVEDSSPSPVRIEGLSSGTLARVRQGLREAVQHPRGTGRTARLEAVSIAGKTGTAEVGGTAADHAWFAGFAPAEAPRVAFAVVVENGGSGGAVAAPVAREFVRTLRQTGVLPESNATAQSHR